MRRVSVIINTDGRARSLSNTIDGLRRLDYPEFEVCVVCGPTPDGTRKLAEAYAERGWIKVAYCPDRNLSQSRNIGIAMAAGEIIAFIDDDAIPEPEWLSQLIAAYRDPLVKGAGGKVFDHTGYKYQYVYSICDRLGNAVLNLTESGERHNFPFSNLFPYVQGANSSFERAALVEIGGFDEEFEFYLDETDVCCRLVDQGHVIRQLADAAVHHKYLPSSIRNEDRITTVKYPVIKNKIYFSIVNNHGHFPFQRVVEDGLAFASAQREDLEFHVTNGRLPATILDDFAEEVERAWCVGLKRGLSGQRRTRPAAFFGAPEPFLRCPVLAPSGPRKTFVFLSQNFPPKQIDGIARYTAEISRAIAAKGHTVHVLSRGEEHSRVDLEDGVWIHRMLDKGQIPEKLPSGEIVPTGVWNHSRTLLEEIERISSFRKIDVVEASSWDCENLAILLDGRFPVATNIVTTLSHWLDTHAELRLDAKWMGEFGAPMQSAERLMFERSDMVLAASCAIVKSIEDRYDVPLTSDGRLRTCVHGMEDMRGQPRRAPAALADLSDGPVRILFLGRLELRKGIDNLLAAVPGVLRANPQTEFWIAGDDTLVLDGGLTARQQFMAEHGKDENIVGRVHFLGKVSDEELRWLYANCDIYTSPSRFESFGLIFVEAMMFSKASVGTRTSGIEEILEHDVTGLLARVDDVASLEEEIIRLAADPVLRRRLGERGRLEFERVYASSVVAERRIALLSEIMRVETPAGAICIPEAARQTERGHLLMKGHPVEIAVGNVREAHLTFYAHPWSGVAEILLDGEIMQAVDLYHASGRFLTIRVLTDLGKLLSIARADRKSSSAQDTEVIFHGAGLCI